MSWYTLCRPKPLRATPSRDVAGYLLAEQSKSQRGLLVRLCENRRRRLLEDLIPDERGRVVGHIGVGDARFGSLSRHRQRTMPREQRFESDSARCRSSRQPY